MHINKNTQTHKHKLTDTPPPPPPLIPEKKRNEILILQHTPGIEKVNEWTYHFVIDFMKMNFTDFLYDVFTLKSYEAKSYAERETEKGDGGRGGDKEGKNWVSG